MNAPRPGPAPGVVLDTNVVLDWLLFADPRSSALSAALVAGHVRWLATTAMRDELAHVLGRGIASRPGHAADATLAAFDRWAVVVPAPRWPPVASLRCTDGDDQQFIDLALHVGAAALLSRDRAVLRLARRAMGHGLTIATPERWTGATTQAR